MLSLIFSVIQLIQATLIELSVESVILSIFEFSAASTTRHRIVDKCHRSVNSLMIRLTRTHSDSDQACVWVRVWVWVQVSKTLASLSLNESKAQNILLSESERVSHCLPTHSLVYSFSALLSALLRLTITITSISTCSEAIYCSCTHLIFIHERRRLRRRCPDVPFPTNSFEKLLTNTSYVVIYLKTNQLTGFRALITRIRRYYQTVPRRAWMMWGIGVKKHSHLGRES